MNDKLRAGIGFDAHSLVPGRCLVLGGVEIPFDRELSGWSDADALTHAIIDALLGAAALGNIGGHFPPGDPEYQDISSLVLLAKTADELAKNSWRVNNVDATIVAEKPTLKDSLDPMRRQLSWTLGIDIDQVSVKASTADRLGFIGRSEGIAVYTIATVEKI